MNNNTTRVLLWGFIGFVAMMAVTGCTTDPNTAKMDEKVKLKASSRIPSLVQQKGAAIALRVSFDGVTCEDSAVTLRRVADGRIPDDKSYRIGTGLEFAWNDRVIKRLLGNDGDTRVAFQAIEPGRYLVTGLVCGHEGRRISIATWDKTILGIPALSAKPLVVDGPNFISVGKGQIIDAGSLDIIPIHTQFYKRGGLGRLVSSEAPNVFREAMKLNLPELYPKIAYTKFTGSSEELIQYKVDIVQAF